MRIYPAIRAQMGDWHYYIVRMKMREVAHEVQLAHDIYKDKTLSDAVQRTLGERRVKKEIVGYLARREDRFFSSIVVAAMDGEPSWFPIEMDSDVVPEIFSRSTSLRESFGVLSFGDEPKYYALDGQHRVAAIKLLVNGEAELEPPAGFDEDLLSVIVVLREEHNFPDEKWMRRYRKLFSSLNRYAKPTDKDTNIIMDEDDIFAILTRRLITDHSFFMAPGPERDSFRVQTKGKALRRGATHFTTLQTLYEMNKTLLSTRERENRGWPPSGAKIDLQVRPEEDFLEECYDELASYWDAILKALPELHNEPREMRFHDAEDSGEGTQDHAAFWPIGQELFAKLARNLLDDRFPEGGCADVQEMEAALKPLSLATWQLHDLPWRHILLVRSPTDGSWRIRNEDRKLAVELMRGLQRWILGLDSHDKETVAELRERWTKMLYPEPPTETRVREMWNEILRLRGRIVTN